MSESISKPIKDGGLAFPMMIPGEDLRQRGMSLLDYFAGQALAGYMTIPDERTYNKDCGKSQSAWQTDIEDNDARFLYRIAAAMLKERERLTNASIP